MCTVRVIWGVPQLHMYICGICPGHWDLFWKGRCQGSLSLYVKLLYDTFMTQ